MKTLALILAFTVTTLSKFTNIKENIGEQQLNMGVGADDNDPDQLTHCSYKTVKLMNATYYLNVNFQDQIVEGTVIYLMQALASPVSEVVFDAWGLENTVVSFSKEWLDKDDQSWDTDINANLVLSEKNVRGGKIVVDTSDIWDNDTPIPDFKKFFLKIKYQTMKYSDRGLGARTGQIFVNIAGDQKLENTVFYTQNEPVYLRTWIPSFDTPQVFYSWKAYVTAPKSLNLYMSGKFIDSTELTDTIQYEYDSLHNQLPAYTIALVIGAYEKAKLDDGLQVVAGQGLIDIAKVEFKDLRKYITEIETYLDFEYKFQYLTIVIMPANYPFEGIAHPGMFYIHPSALNQFDTGKSILYYLLGNIYFGNIISIKNWRHVWLNQGFAQYIERRMLYELKPVFGYLDGIDGDFRLRQSIKGLPSGIRDNLSTLYPVLDDESDPDELISIVPVEKGFQFLKYIESIIGEEGMQFILQGWIKVEDIRSVGYLDFKDFLEYTIDTNIKFQNVKQKVLNIDWDGWVTTVGYPPVQFEDGKDSTEYISAVSLADKFVQLDGTSIPNNYQDFFQWIPDQQYIFLDSLLYNIYLLDKRLTKDLDKKYTLGTNTDTNIRWRWHTLTIKNKYNVKDSKINAELQLYLTQTGRLDFLKPIYETLLETNQDDLAEQFLGENKDYYHPFVYDAIYELIHGEIKD